MAQAATPAVNLHLDQPAVMRGNSRPEQLGLYRVEGLDGTALVGPDQPRVTHNIGSQDCGETAGLAHVASPAASRRPDR